MDLRYLANKEREFLLQFSDRIDIAGSIRRRVKNPKDIDLVIVPRDEQGKQEIIDYAFKHPKGNLGNGRKVVSYRKEGIQIQIWFATHNHVGAMLLFATGSGSYNIGLRNLASRKGMVLNRYGLFKGQKILASRTEEDIYIALGKKYKDPELRGLSPKEMREIWGVSKDTRILPKDV